jgi:hypothetical protein
MSRQKKSQRPSRAEFVIQRERTPRHRKIRVLLSEKMVACRRSINAAIALLPSVFQIIVKINRYAEHCDRQRSAPLLPLEES